MMLILRMFSSLAVMCISVMMAAYTAGTVCCCKSLLPMTEGSNMMCNMPSGYTCVACTGCVHVRNTNLPHTITCSLFTLVSVLLYLARDSCLWSLLDYLEDT